MRPPRVDLAAEHEEHRCRQCVSNLAGGVAHAFNNAFAVVLGAAENLTEDIQSGEEGRDDESLLQDVARIRRGLARALALNEQLQQLSDCDHSLQSAVDLNVVSSGLASRVRDALGGHAQLELVLSSAQPVVVLERTKLELAIMNLALNSVAAMPDDGHLTIETGVTTGPEPMTSQVNLPPTWAYLAVTDNGDGMDQDTQDRAFEMFFTTKPACSGLGLAIVRNIVMSAGGRATIASGVGLGAAVTLYLPLVEDR